jgi:hypothetical protein
MGISFREEIQQYRAGMINKGRDFDIVGSSQLETADAKAGLFVAVSGDGKVALPTTEAEVTAGNGGFLIYMPDRRANADGFEWQVDDYVQYLRNGYIVAITEEAVSAGDPVYVRFDTGTGSQKGACRNDADTATCGLLPRAYFVRDATSGLALVDYYK